MFKLIIPCYGDQSDNLDNLVKSIDSQKTDFEVECFFLEDQISEDFRLKLQKLCGAPNNKFLVENDYGKRLFALKNICRFLDSFDWSNDEDNCIIGLIETRIV